MAVEAPAVPILSKLRAPDGRPAVEIFKGHPYFTEVDQSLNKSQAGPGMFVSRKDPKTGEQRLFPMLIPVTRVARDPVNEERTIDIPMQDDQGRVLMQLCPAARATIFLSNDKDEAAESLPTTPFPDAKDNMAVGLEKLGQIIVDQNAAAEKRFETMISTLVSVLKEKT